MNSSRPTPLTLDMITSRPWLRAMALAALVAGILDAGFAVAAYVVVAGRFTLLTVLQYIATGLIGDRAYAHGLAGLGTAALGVAVHFSLALAFTVLFALTAARYLRTATQVVVIGLIYGALIWTVNAGFLLPALGVAHEAPFTSYWWAFLIDHALLVGLPIAWLTRNARLTRTALTR